jgi:hypothetical protein
MRDQVDVCAMERKIGRIEFNRMAIVQPRALQPDQIVESLEI